MHKFLIIICFIILFVLYYHLNSKDSASSLPLIVWWTPNIYPHVNDGVRVACGKGDCMSTKSRDVLHSLDNKQLALAFYGTDFNENDLPTHKPRRNQLWALLHEESPMNNFMFSHLFGLQLFNWTSTFQRSSNFPLTTLFLPNLDYITERKPISLSIKNKLRQNNIAPLLYIQSNCDVPSDRDTYVSELSKYLQIDSYGKCLNNKELPTNLRSRETFNDGEFLDFIAQYKFHLTFENAICYDYVTEKLFRAFHVGSIPVYKGAPNIFDWAPNNKSVILIDDFPSPADLAKLIRTLDSNDSLYEEFLVFKKLSVNNLNDFLVEHLKSRRWGVGEDEINFVEAFECYICDRLHENLDSSSSQNPITLHEGEIGCPPPTKYVFESTEIIKKDVLNWTLIYWQSMENAASVVNSEAAILKKHSYTNVEL